MSTTPKHRVVLRDLRAQIAAGTWAPHEQLPTEVTLAARYGVSRQTVRRAFQDLVADGLVQRTPRRGTFVTPSGALHLRPTGSVDDLLALAADTMLEVLTPLQLRSDATVAKAAARLTPEGDEVGHVSFVRVHDGIRFCHTDIFLPPDVTDRLNSAGVLATEGEVREVTVLGLIEEHTGRRIAEAHQAITAVRAGRSTARILGCRVGHPLLGTDRFYLDAEGTPVEWATSLFVSRHYTYRTVLRRTR